MADIFKEHQIKIARKTINLPDAMANILGGMTKAEAEKILIDERIIERDYPKIFKKAKKGKR